MLQWFIRFLEMAEFLMYLGLIPLPRKKTSRQDQNSEQLGAE